MTSETPDNTLLKVLGAVAIVLVIVGGSLYMGALLAPEQEAPKVKAKIVKPVTPVPIDAPVQVSVKPSGPKAAPPAPPDDNETPFTGLSAPTLPGVADLATRPVVLPSSDRPAAQALMEANLEALDGCWRDAAEEADRSGKLFVHFRVRDGAMDELQITTKHVGDPTFEVCATNLVRGFDVGALEDGTSVFWPVELDKKHGAKL